MLTTALASAALAVLPAAALLPPAAAQSSAAKISPQLQAAGKAFHAGYAAVARNDLNAAEADFAKVVRLSPQIAAGHAAYGSVLLSLGRLQDAIRELDRAHVLDPDEDSATQNLARAYQQAGYAERALALFDFMEQKHTAMTPDAWYAYAQLLLATHKLTTAYDRMVEALDTYPQNATLEDTMGVVLARQQEEAGAEQHFRRALTLDPQLARSHLHLGTILLLQKQPASAISELELAVTGMPQDADAYLELGRALTASHQDDAAINALQKAMALAGSSFSAGQAASAGAGTLSMDIRYALAVALQNRGRSPEAVPLFEEAAAARPTEPAVLTNLGLALVQTGKAREALAYYDKALALDAHNWIIQQDVGVAYLQQSDLNHAIEHFQLGLVIEPENAQLHYDLGLAYKLKDNVPAAIAAFTKAEAEDASLADTPYTLGVLYMQVGRFAEAQTELKKATTLKPDNGDAWSVLGSVDKSLDQPDLAIADFKTAIRLQPALPGNHVTLAAVYAQQGLHEEAAAERRIAADLSRAAVNKQKSAFALDSARTLLQHGRIEEAVTQLNTSIAADPANPAAHLVLADAWTQEGKAADAALERHKAALLTDH